MRSRGKGVLLDRRAFVRAGAAALLPLAGMPARAAGGESHLLDPRRVADYDVPPASTAEVQGGKVTYAMQGPERGTLIVYFHGWGDDNRIVLPLEYPLLDAGFRLLVVHRPGYAGTALEGIAAGETHNWRTAAGSAQMAGLLLDRLQHRKWRVAVMGTSGGVPAALAFASLFPAQTRALVSRPASRNPGPMPDSCPLCSATHITLPSINSDGPAIT